MSAYVYLCAACGTKTVIEKPIGTAQRITKCGCGRPARMMLGQGMYIAAAATPNKRQNVLTIEQREKNWDRDIPAYKRMRARGLQPVGVDGAAAVEDTVGDQDDIDYGGAIRVASDQKLYRQMTDRAEVKVPAGGGKERVIETVEAVKEGTDWMKKETA